MISGFARLDSFESGRSGWGPVLAWGLISFHSRFTSNGPLSLSHSWFRARGGKRV